MFRAIRASKDFTRFSRIVILAIDTKYCHNKYSAIHQICHLFTTRNTRQMGLHKHDAEIGVNNPCTFRYYICPRSHSFSLTASIRQIPTASSKVSVHLRDHPITKFSDCIKCTDHANSRSSPLCVQPRQEVHDDVSYGSGMCGDCGGC